MSLGKDGRLIEEYVVKPLYEASKLTGLSLPSLTYSADKGKMSITRRKDSKEFLISWGKIHDACFEIRREERWRKKQF